VVIVRGPAQGTLVVPASTKSERERLDTRIDEIDRERSIDLSRSMDKGADRVAEPARIVVRGRR